MEQSPARYGAASVPQYSWTLSEPQPAGYSIRPRIRNRPVRGKQESVLEYHKYNMCENDTQVKVHSGTVSLYFLSAAVILKTQQREPHEIRRASGFRGDRRHRSLARKTFPADSAFRASRQAEMNREER
ncbi:hypothetical protein EYF80_032771 [Liparis tanakae]|uniref:Uncharacterized protein n=1 Tax=Liparis tanakae TaxID=230148 RepID=A0A4Z2GUD4_9TELE|nr:hypothetical protein EYF80_032771 [Liparis tanakae]